MARAKAKTCRKGPSTIELILKSIPNEIAIPKAEQL